MKKLGWLLCNISGMFSCVWPCHGCMCVTYVDHLAAVIFCLVWDIYEKT